MPVRVEQLSGDAAEEAEAERLGDETVHAEETKRTARKQIMTVIKEKKIVDFRILLNRGYG